MTASGAVELSVKYLLGRTRPKLWLENQEFTIHPLTHGWAVNSFPSGHSQASWAAMTALALLFPRYARVFIGIATLVALSRVMLTVHWLSDAMAGAWLGFAAALILRAIILKPRATES
jgi:membrane-associated phospholipid phosphatase